MALSAFHLPEEIRAAAMAVGNALARCEKYALVGGSACVVLGSTRATQDVDLVVLRGGTSNARQLLRASSYFEVEPRTNHTTYKTERPVPIEILTLSLLFREPFDQSTEAVTVGSVKVLKPALLLNAKCATEVPNATKELVQYLIQFYGGQEAWVRAGYNFQTGLSYPVSFKYHC
ncbi:hypothetical protein BDV41DRAFT_585162 [Aspergillus transmontanensis]|uniref:Polymerase nucleotidyl transferase domain-containing protein n=1 Tax=Aspergillus transmontanensis TaxID=1034304 RepID=A0A5N6VEH9_9EURO|nr:hypothetical protein BDV41DRAFT_585162 [Aspergillus transmontanensis]